MFLYSKTPLVHYVVGPILACPIEGRRSAPLLRPASDGLADFETMSSGQRRETAFVRRVHVPLKGQKSDGRTDATERARIKVSSSVRVRPPVEVTNIARFLPSFRLSEPLLSRSQCLALKLAQIPSRLVSGWAYALTVRSLTARVIDLSGRIQAASDWTPKKILLQIESAGDPFDS